MITSVMLEQSRWRPLLRRSRSTGLTRRIALGTWRYRRGEDFAALYRCEPAVIVSLQDAGFQRPLVLADDAEAVAARIRAGT